MLQIVAVVEEVKVIVRHSEMDFQVDLAVVLLLTGQREILAELLEMLHQDLEEIQVVSILGLQMLAEAVERDKQAKQVDPEQVALVDTESVLLLQDLIIQ